MNETNTFLSRVYDAKLRFYREHGCQATELFLGPKELYELREYVVELENNGLLIEDEKIQLIDEPVLAGMKIIGLASDGMRAGISVT